MTPEILGIWISAILTLVVFSFLLADNPLYRLAEHILVGSVLAYTTVVAVHQVLLPRLILPLAQDPQGNWPLFLPLALGILLLAKANESTSWLGNTSLAYLFGVGAALAVGGALGASFLRQVQATVVSLDPQDSGVAGAFDNFILVLGTLATLAYFTFTFRGQQGLLPSLRSGLGRAFIMVTLGALFANLAISRLPLLLDRIQFLLGDWLGLIS